MNSTESRRVHLQRLREEPLDVLILGGGINGAGIARDLALRALRCGMPLRIGLVEKRHFASGTSGKNSQLIHGGLRYLKQFEFRLVRESLRERGILLRIAPHLVQPQPFLIPMYGWFARLFYETGLWMYDLLAGRRNVGKHRTLSREEVEHAEPGLLRQGLTSGAVFYDCRVHSARFVLQNIFDAVRMGVLAVNYARAEKITPSGAAVVDVLTGESFRVRARKVVDATGPWEDKSNLRLVRGSHLILPRLTADDHGIAYFEKSGRIVFVIPWGTTRPLSLVGTTDFDHTAGPDDVHITAEECAYLLGIVRHIFPNTNDLAPISAFSSLRPLLRSNSGSATETSREHRIWNSPEGILHVAGGKYTTYRAMSQEASEAVVREIAPQLAGKCFTAETLLGDELRDRPRSEQIAFAVQHEMAQSLYDLLFVSTYWGYEQSWTADDLRPIASEMGGHLGWDGKRTDEEIEQILRQTAVPLPP